MARFGCLRQRFRFWSLSPVIIGGLCPVIASDPTAVRLPLHRCSAPGVGFLLCFVPCAPPMALLQAGAEASIWRRKRAEDLIAFSSFLQGPQDLCNFLYFLGIFVTPDLLMQQISRVLCTRPPCKKKYPNYFFIE
jgi:hypothetical protein